VRLFGVAVTQLVHHSLSPEFSVKAVPGLHKASAGTRIIPRRKTTTSSKQFHAHKKTRKYMGRDKREQKQKTQRKKPKNQKKKTEKRRRYEVNNRTTAPPIQSQNTKIPFVQNKKHRIMKQFVPPLHSQSSNSA
jgi:hypothetical protein